jgi:sialate O-acetylesterase
MYKLFFTFFLAFCGFALQADIRLPRFFGDNMVLQRDQPIPVWGWADPKEKVTIQLKAQTQTVIADKSGKWSVRLLPEAAGGPYQLTLKGKNSITLQDVLIGDVWVCSGQSNMEWVVKDCQGADQEVVIANFPQIRHFKVPHTIASEPKVDVSGGEWKFCSPSTVEDFTAVGYFFAKELNQAINVPIGLLNISWGGTHSETWTSREAFESDEEFKAMMAGMAHLNLDSLAQQKRMIIQKRIEQLQGVSGYQPEEVVLWKSIGFNAAKWPQISVPDLWESQAPGDFDGELWLRKTIIIDAGDAGESALLEIAMIDDDDETYVNGTMVGSTHGYNIKRKYVVPPGILKEGENVVVVKVTDTGGGGGIWGDAGSVKLTIGAKVQSLAGFWSYQIAAASGTVGGVGPNSYPTLLSNAMLNPAIPYAIKGVIWYQGESNAGRAYQYRKAFPLMITDWRKRWNQGDFPFYFVQLASYNAENGNSQQGSTWAELREAQTLSLSLPNTGMAVTTDIGDPNDIHPKNKQDVGKRLAAIALSKTYGKNILCSGPVFQSMTTEGNKALLTFTQTGGGLMAKDKYGFLKGFEIAGADQKFVYAKAWVEGDRVVVFQDGVSQPAAVRFGWADDAGEDNLFNKEGFPAVPFRTDNWKGVTEERRFSIDH